MRFNLIGAGRLGLNLAKALIECSHAELLGLSNRSLESAEVARSQLKCGRAVLLTELPPADITFITVPDAEIESVVNALLAAAVLTPGSYVVHCSGVLSSSILAPLYSQSVLLASVHPLRPFRAGSLFKDCLQACYCALEGDEPVVAWLRSCLTQCGAHLMTISKEAKALYHAAAVFASNYPLTLAQAAEHNFIKSGMPADLAHLITADLMAKMIENYRVSDSAAAALTGPLLRADEQTVALHLSALEEDDARFYRMLGEQTLALTEHDKDVTAKLIALLQSH